MSCYSIEESSVGDMAHWVSIGKTSYRYLHELILVAGHPETIKNDGWILFKTKEKALAYVEMENSKIVFNRLNK